MSYKYKAFISYSRKDIKIAQWLFNKLESYTLPSKMRKENSSLPKKLGRFFKDVDELSAYHELNDKLKESLRNSEFLIVLCSKDSAQSYYVNEEIKYFKSINGEDRVICIIINGEPNATKNEKFDDNEECYPVNLRFEINRDENLTKIEKNPLAPDIRKGKDSKTKAKIKVIARLLNLEFDDLWEREKRRIIKNRILQSFVVISFIIVSFYGFNKYQEQEYLKVSNILYSEVILEIENVKIQLLDEKLNYSQYENLNKKLKKLEEDRKAIQNLQDLFKQNTSEWVKEINRVLNEKGVNEAIVLIKDFDKNKIKNQKKEISDFHKISAQTYILNGNYDDALENYEEAIKYSDNIELWNEYGLFALAQNETKKAQEIYLRVINILKNQKDKSSDEYLRDYSRSLNNLALSYYSTNKVKEAIALQKEALEIRKEAYLKNKDRWLEYYSGSLNNLAMSYKSINKVEEAIVLQEEALVITKEAYLKNKDRWLEDYSTSLNNLGSLYYSTNKVKEAIVLQEEALAIRKKAYLNNKDRWLLSLNNLAMSYKSINKVEEAIVLQEEALVITKEAYLKNKDRWLENYSTSLNNLGSLYYSTNKVKEAIVLQEEALVITKEAYLKNKDRWLENYSTSLNNLAMSYKSINKVEEAIVLQEEALVITKEAYLNNKDRWLKLYSKSLNNLAVSYYKIENYKESIKLFEEQYIVLKNKYDESSPELISIRENIIATYLKKNSKRILRQSNF
jgi:tetratricopeptide (TPR) repeat protein